MILWISRQLSGISVLFHQASCEEYLTIGRIHLRSRKKGKRSSFRVSKRARLKYHSILLGIIRWRCVSISKQPASFGWIIHPRVLLTVRDLHRIVQLIDQFVLSLLIRGTMKVGAKFSRCQTCATLNYIFVFFKLYFSYLSLDRNIILARINLFIIIINFNVVIVGYFYSEKFCLWKSNNFNNLRRLMFMQWKLIVSLCVYFRIIQSINRNLRIEKRRI